MIMRLSVWLVGAQGVKGGLDDLSLSTSIRHK
jgi:hypothetical protein